MTRVQHDQPRPLPSSNVTLTDKTRFCRPSHYTAYSASITIAGHSKEASKPSKTSSQPARLLLACRPKLRPPFFYRQRYFRLEYFHCQFSPWLRCWSKPLSEAFRTHLLLTPPEILQNKGNATRHGKQVQTKQSTLYRTGGLYLNNLMPALS